MSQKKERRKVKKTNVKDLLKVCAVLAVCVYAAVVFVQQKITLSKCETVADEYKEKIAAAQLEKQKLEDELEKAGTDEYLERIARDKLGLVKANERVFIDITQ
ncbi:MAG: septum formation initiator family protein [Clostridia bacterium]|nr:septum formation initiator family protein [Clostridia bacterium]